MEMTRKELDYYLNLHRFDYNFYLRVTKMYDFILNNPDQFRDSSERDEIFATLKAKIAPTHSELYTNLFRGFISKRSYSLELFVAKHSLEMILYCREIMENLFKLTNLIQNKGYASKTSPVPVTMLTNVAQKFLQAAKEDGDDQWVYLRCLRISVIGGLLREVYRRDHIRTIIRILQRTLEEKKRILKEVYSEDELYYRITMDGLEMEERFYNTRASLDEFVRDKRAEYHEGYSNAETLEERNYYDSLNNNLIDSYREYNPALRIKHGEMAIYNEYLDYLALQMSDFNYMFYHTAGEFRLVHDSARKYLLQFTKENLRSYMLNYLEKKYAKDEISSRKYSKDIELMRDYGIITFDEAEEILSKL